MSYDLLSYLDDGELRAYLFSHLFTELSAKDDSIIAAQVEAK